ncbi:hypothetical protein BURK1_00499 [Burkholderiales bacterium]|nr:hypothetical protein BURK1_00499 [Burkholderiales bacterium]
MSWVGLHPDAVDPPARIPLWVGLQPDALDPPARVLPWVGLQPDADPPHERKRPGRNRGAIGHHVRYFAVDFGSASLTLTTNFPSRIALSFAATLSLISFGTLVSNVPSGASSLPRCFIIEYGP